MRSIFFSIMFNCDFNRLTSMFVVALLSADVSGNLKFEIRRQKLVPDIPSTGRVLKYLEDYLP